MQINTAIMVGMFSVMVAGFGYLTVQFNKLDSKFDAKIDAQGASLGARIDAQGTDLGNRISQLDAKIDAQGASLGARLDSMSSRLDLIGMQLIEHIHQHV